MFWFPIHFGMKRESGENPELSRSCELQNSQFTQLSLSVTDGKTEKRGVSQKTCQNTCTIHSFRGLELE